MLGWFRAEAVRASCFNRSNCAAFATNDGGSSFQRDLAPQPFVFGKINYAHPATPRTEFIR